MNWTTDKPTEAGWTATVRDKARKLYGLLHAEVSRDQVCGPEDVKAIRKMEIVDIGLLIAALDDSYQQGRAVACEWTYDEMDDHYETACKNAYCLADGTLKDNEHKYCPYCGGLIQLAQQAKGVRE